MKSPFVLLPLLIFNLLSSVCFAQHDAAGYRGTMEVGVARVDITPEGPIRLAGYGARANESDGVLEPLYANALAFGSDEQGPSVLITVDLIGIPGHLTRQLAGQLHRKAGLITERLTVTATHTHSGPEVGTLLNHFNEPLPPEHLGHIAKYLDQLSVNLEQVALQALENRSAAAVSWGQGEAGFAMNRRVLEDGKWTGFGVVPDGPVDQAMPVMRITDPDGTLRAVMVNYACHGTTLGGDINEVHGDWMGEARRIIEERHPRATALITIGAGGDANPEPRTLLEHTTQHGTAIADEVDRLLSAPLNPLTDLPQVRYRTVNLPYAETPGIDELVVRSGKRGAEGYYARTALDRLVRGEPLPRSVTYPLQTWTFGDDLAMVFLAGEVVVDYALRLKQELGAERLWVTAYANEVSGYIPSRRVIREGGYEVESSMYSYDHPSPFSEVIEGRIMEAVYDLLPGTFKPLVSAGEDGTLKLSSEAGLGIGPGIEYMPEWKAYGWFTAGDHVEWEVDVARSGRYQVHMDWSVSDQEAGKPFTFRARDQVLRGRVGPTGSWETFKSRNIGTLQLFEGRQKMVFRPDSLFEAGALLDLRGLTLIPVD